MAGAPSHERAQRRLEDEHGRLKYERIFTVGVDFPREVAEHLERHHFVVAQIR